MSDVLLDLLAALFGQEAWWWLSGSLFTAILWSNVGWFFRKPRLGAFGDTIERFVATPFVSWLFQFLRLIYYLGLPFAALFWGQDAVVGRILGLQPLIVPLTGFGEAGSGVSANWLDWLSDIGWLAALGGAGLTALALGGWAYWRALMALGLDDGATIAGLDRLAIERLLEAAYHEVHWAFYRNAPVVFLRSFVEDGTYWGVWAGFALAALEAMLNPRWRRGMTDVSRALALLARGGWAVVSAAFFLTTQNLWLAILLHGGVMWGWAALMRRWFPAPSPSSGRPT
jgi:hypothetical protein